MHEQDQEKRLNHILDMIGNMAALDFSKVLTTSRNNDMIDAIALGLNMLAEELNTQVVARTKLDEINQKLDKFAHTTAHDLKSPLNNASALLSLLESSVETSNKEEAREYIEKLYLMNKKMRNLIEGILQYSKTYSMELASEEVNFNDVILEVMESDNIIAFADVKIENTLPTVLFNRTAGVQVVRNLVDNAIKYCDKDRCTIKVLSSEINDSYKIVFNDNGPGIDPEHHEKVFELYNRINADDNSNSIGLGLATVKNVIESAGGKIWLESNPGQGASFIFTLRKPK